MLSLVIIFILISSSISINVIGTDNKNSKDSDIKILNEDIFFSTISEKKQNNYCVLELSEKEDIKYLAKPGEPMLPEVTRLYTFPIGTKIFDIDFEISDISIEPIDYKIKPAPQKLSLKTISKSNDYQDNFEKSSIYDSEKLYPNSWFDYDITVGRENGKRAIVLKIKSYPIRYSPKENMLYKISNLNFQVSYQENKNPIDFYEQYDMVIISPEKYINSLNRLANHKNSHNVKTMIKSVEDIYFEYAGRDEAEEIKYFLKDSLDKHNITYALFVGGRSGQKPSWDLPSRYSNTHDQDEWNDTFVTDLYFADIYRYNNITDEIEFDDWDSNNNGIFAEWTWVYRDGSFQEEDKKDILDLRPDIFVGRIPCRNVYDLNVVIDKIIKYENESYGSEWLNRAIMIGGDTFIPTNSRYFTWNTTKVPDGLYTISIQSITQNRYSEVKSVLVFVLNNLSNKSKALSNVKNINLNFFKKGKIDMDPDIYIELKNPNNFNFLSGITNINFITNDRKNDRSSIYVNLTIKNLTDQVVYKKQNKISDVFFEGEIVTNHASKYLKPEDYDIIKLNATSETLIDASSVRSELKNGAKFIFLTGHSTPREWSTHPVFSSNEWIDLYQYQMQFLNNKEKLPICIVDGCHTNQFDVSLSNIKSGYEKYGIDYFNWDIGIENFFKWTWISNCWSWNLVKQKNGGFIASIGNTGLGWGGGGPFSIWFGGGNLTSEFFRIYVEESQLGNDALGHIHSKTINYYIDNFDTNSEVTDRKILEEWVLLGDPSLKIGGYK